MQRSLYAAAVEDLDNRPDLQAWAMVGLGLPMAPSVPLSEHVMWLDRLVKVLPHVGDRVSRVFLTSKAAMVLVAMGKPAWRELTDHIINQTGGAPRQVREVHAYFSVAVDACYAGHHETADGLLRAAQAGAAAFETRRMDLVIRAAFTLLDCCRGTWEGLDDRVATLREELADFTLARLDVEVVAGCLALARGNLEAAEHLLTETVRRLEAMGGVDLLPLPVSASVRLAVGRGDATSAVEHAQTVLAAVESKGVWAPGIRLLPAAAEAMIVAGQIRMARTLVARAAREVRGRDIPLASAALTHARGFLGTADEQWAAATRHFLAAAERYEPLQCPYEAAQAREQAASCLFAAGQPGAAAALQAALATYGRLGATWDAGRAAHLARERGVPLPARHRGGRRGYGTELSPREREVAERAASGRRTKEIARELFLSPSTVDKHLGAAMRKLGVRSRAALAHRLGASAREGGKSGGFPP